MTQLTITLIQKLASPRRPRFQTRPGFLAALVFRIACAGLLVWVGAVHLHLWSEGYRESQLSARCSSPTPSVALCWQPCCWCGAAR